MTAMKNLVFAIAGMLLVAGCSKDSSKEPKAEAEVNVNLGKEKNSLEGALDKAGREMKEGAREAKAKLQDAGETLKEKAQAAKDKLTDDKKAEVKVEVNK